MIDAAPDTLAVFVRCTCEDRVMADDIHGSDHEREDLSLLQLK